MILMSYEPISMLNKSTQKEIVFLKPISSNTQLPAALQFSTFRLLYLHFPTQLHITGNDEIWQSSEVTYLPFCIWYRYVTSYTSICGASCSNLLIATAVIASKIRNSSHVILLRTILL